MGPYLVNTSRWFLMAIFMASLWLWGGTRPWTVDLIRWVLLGNLLLFCAGLIAERRLPRISLIASLLVMMLLAEGWWHVLYIQFHPLNDVPAGDFIPMIARFNDAPLAMKAMLLITGLVGTFCIACDLSTNRQWLQRLWITMAAGGISIVALGLAQIITKAPAIFWNEHEDTGNTFFAVFRYHANAGAFLNLLLPLVGGLCMISVIRQWNQTARVFWLVSFCATLASVFVNISRGGHLVCVVTFLIAFLMVILLRPLRGTMKLAKVIIPFLVMMAGVALLACCIGVNTSLSRWKEKQFDDPQRLLTYHVIVKNLVPETGCFGYGAGSFKSVFASAVEASGLPVEGNWTKAHNDHLQAIVEWGWGGYSMWVILLAGAIAKGIKLTRSAELRMRIFGFCASLSVFGVMLHSLVDFPLQITSLQLMTALLAGMLWGAVPEKITNFKSGKRG